MNANTDSKSEPYYFISYSRQEVTFADSFSRELEKRGIHNWVDFRNLVPGTPWQPQLDAGVNNAAAILLVVSKASMSSAPVKDEWVKSLAANKRIILIIFEPCKMDDSLAGLEWVDFTGNFNAAMNKLMTLLSQPPQKITSVPPQKGIRMPVAVKWFLNLSVLAAILALVGGFITMSLVVELFSQTLITQFNILGNDSSLAPSQLRDTIIIGLFTSVFIAWIPAIWNFALIPNVLRNRAHNVGQLRTALNVLLFANMFLLLFPLSTPSGIWDGVDLTETLGGMMINLIILMLIIFAMSFVLNRLMVSDSMYRWAGPTGAIIRAKRPKLEKNQKSQKALKVMVDAASQDRAYAREFLTHIVKAGHAQTENIQEADVVLPLLSAYKNNSNCDPQTKRVIPVLLQSCDVDPNLSQVQWVDLRYGKDSMSAVANLLDKPEELMRTLGVLPVRTIILPNAVKRLAGLLSILFGYSIYFALSSIAGVNAVAEYQELAGFDFLGYLIPSMILPALILLGYYFFRRYVIERKLKNFKFLSYSWALGFAVLLAVMASLAGWEPAWVVTPLAWLLPLLMLSKEVRMWLPASAK